MSQFDAKPNAFFQVEVCGKRLQIIAEFRAAIELFKILFGRYIRGPFAEAGKLRGVLGRRGDKIGSLITPTTAHRVTLLEAEDIRRWISIKKILQRYESTGAGTNNGDLHATCSLDNREANEHIVELARFRHKKQDTVAGRHRLGFQIFIKYDKDA